MTAEELSKYAGKKTFGKNNEILTNGIIVGYDPDDNQQCLVARFENGDVSGMGWSISSYKIKFFTKKEEEIYNSGKGCYLFARIENVIMEEEKGLDLTKILEGCEGVELWSDIFGKCKLESSDGGDNYEIEVLVLDTISGDNGYEQFTKYGRLYYCYPNGKCMLWPSETCRDWSQFKKPIKVKDGEIVACADNLDYINIRKYSGGNTCYSSNGKTTWMYIIPFDKFNPNLSKEELKKLSIV